MKTFKLLSIAFLLSISISSTSFALFGVGDIVSDPYEEALTTIKNIKDLIYQTWHKVSAEYNWTIQAYNEGQMIVHQIEQIQNEYNQIQQMTTALQGINPSSFSTLKSSLQDTYNKSQSIFNNMRGMTNTVSDVQNKFESTYPAMNSMGQMDPAGWKTIVDTTTTDQRNNIYNAQIKAANIQAMNTDLQTKLNTMTTQNTNVQGIKEAAQLGNQIAIQQQQLAMETNANLALMLKQNADNINNLQMLQQAMQLEANKTFTYTKTPATTQGAGLYQIK